MHLLEQEPDHRYQSAEGLAHDLEQVQAARADPTMAPVRIGEHDVPLRLLPPSRLVGRDNEVAALRAAFEDAIEVFGDTAVPWLAEIAGFRGALLFADPASGHLISETVWQDPAALAASPSAAATRSFRASIRASVSSSV